MGGCVLCKTNEVLDQKTDTTLLNFKGKMSEFFFFEDYQLGD